MIKPTRAKDKSEWTAARMDGWRRSLRLAGACFLTAAAIAAVSILRFGSLRAAAAYMRGEVLCGEPVERSLGNINAGTTARALFRVTNVEDVPVTIVGARTTCGCIKATSLPLTLEPRDSVDIAFAVKPVKLEPGASFHHAVMLYTDLPGPRCVLKISGTAGP